MKRTSATFCTAAVILAALALTPLAAQAKDRCAAPNGSIEHRACAMAAAGPEALRRFIERTRGIYQLYYFDYMRPGA
ncbi:MAG: hypothetical protein ABJB78_03555 [Betaproteobacteria bacterium]